MKKNFRKIAIVAMASLPAVFVSCNDEGNLESLETTKQVAIENDLATANSSQEFDALNIPQPQLRFQFEGNTMDDNGLVEGKLSEGGRLTKVFSPAPSGGQSLAGGYMELNSPLLKDGFEKYTVLFWFESLVQLTTETILYEEGGRANGLAIKYNELGITARVKAGKSVLDVHAPIQVITEGFRYFVAVTYDQGKIRLDIYRNGLFETAHGESGGPVRIPEHPASTGVRGRVNDDVFGGRGSGNDGTPSVSTVLIDDLRIYDGVALTPTQISEIASEPR